MRIGKQQRPNTAIVTSEAGGPVTPLREASRRSLDFVTSKAGDAEMASESPSATTR